MYIPLHDSSGFAQNPYSISDALEVYEDPRGMYRTRAQAMRAVRQGYGGGYLRAEELRKRLKNPRRRRRGPSLRGRRRDRRGRLLPMKRRKRQKGRRRRKARRRGRAKRRNRR